MTTTIVLSEEDAKLFVQFQKRYAMVGLLESVGAFDMRHGSVTINFDPIGGISGVEVKHFYKPLDKSFPQVENKRS